MKDETINYIIDLLNKGEASDYIFLRPLLDNVFLGRVWIENTKGDICKERGYDMFFIQNTEKVFVASVLDMGVDDLHVFVQPESRKKGYLVNALKTVILPYLFSTDREEQQITFKDEMAKHHAELVGFRLLTDSSAVIDSNDLPLMPDINPSTNLPSENHIERVKQRIRRAADFIQMARDDWETTFGNDEIYDEFRDLTSAISDQKWRIHDAWEDYKEGGSR